MLNNRVEAEESAQDCFVKIYFHLKDFDSSRDFAIWASSIAINECRDRLRKRSRFNRSFRELDETIAAPADVNNGTIDKNKLEIVEKALEKLPAKLREILVLKAYGEHSYDDIAQILGLRIGTVMSRLFRARRKLTDILSKGNSA
jgi:RNA polymerase sigma-70 factor (ECF subfamily)